MYRKQCKCLIVPWWHDQLPCSGPHTIVHNANLSVSRSSCHCCWEQGEFPAAVSKLWPGLEFSVNYCVSLGEPAPQGWVPSRQGNFLDSSSFNGSRHLGLLLDHSRPVKCPTLWSKYNSQHSTHKNPGVRQGGSSYFVSWLPWKRITKGSLPLLV